MRRAQDHSVSTIVLHAPAEYARSEGVDVDRILRLHGIPPDTLDGFGARVPAATAMHAWCEMASQTGDPEFGLHLAMRTEIGTYDVLGYIARTSPDLEHGLQQLVRYQRLLGDGWRFDVRADGNTAVIAHEFLVPVRDPRQLVEHHLGIVAMRIREFTRSDWVPLEVGFRHSQPANTELHHHVFGPVVRFGQLTNIIRIDRTQLAWPLNMADRRLARVLERYAVDALRRMPPPGDFAARVRVVLVDLMNEGDCSAAAVARKLHTSPRSLQRHLAEEGSSLRQLVDAVRRELAEEYLSNSWMTLEEIAMLLGFADTSGFTHAFRRWTGRPPIEYRREREQGRKRVPPASSGGDAFAR